MLECSTKTMLSINMWWTRYCARDIRWSTRNQCTQLVKGQVVIQNFFELCHRVAMFHKNDAVNQCVVDKVLCQRYTVEHKELVYPACQRTSCYSKFFRALSQGCNVPQKRCCQSICGRQGINVLEIYGGAQGISLPSAMRYMIFYNSSFEDEHK